MKANSLVTRLATSAFVAALCLGAIGAFGQTEGGDPRKQTTIQTVSVAAGSTQNAVTVKYLNLPWGEKTFSYMEDGGDKYYSTRDWPFAQLTLTVKAKWMGHDLEPGDYVWVITPKSDVKPMGLSIWKFKPGASGTFLVPGDVFTERPADAVMIASKPVKFERGKPLVNHLEISATAKGTKADVMVHYGTREITEQISLD